MSVIGVTKYPSITIQGSLNTDGQYNASTQSIIAYTYVSNSESAFKFLLEQSYPQDKTFIKHIICPHKAFKARLRFYAKNNEQAQKMLQYLKKRNYFTLMLTAQKFYLDNNPQPFFEFKVSGWKKINKITKND